MSSCPGQSSRFSRAAVIVSSWKRPRSSTKGQLLSFRGEFIPGIIKSKLRQMVEWKMVGLENYYFILDSSGK
jgi:hypothetical protein